MKSQLYRRSLKLALDWAVHRYLWRGQAMYIRSLFEANKHITQPRQQRVRQTHRDLAFGRKCHTQGVGISFLLT